MYVVHTTTWIYFRQFRNLFKTFHRRSYFYIDFTWAFCEPFLETRLSLSLCYIWWLSRARDLVANCSPYDTSFFLSFSFSFISLSFRSPMENHPFILFPLHCAFWTSNLNMRRVILSCWPKALPLAKFGPQFSPLPEAIFLPFFFNIRILLCVCLRLLPLWSSQMPSLPSTFGSFIPDPERRMPLFFHLSMYICLLFWLSLAGYYPKHTNCATLLFSQHCRQFWRPHLIPHKPWAVLLTFDVLPVFVRCLTLMSFW